MAQMGQIQELRSTIGQRAQTWYGIVVAFAVVGALAGIAFSGLALVSGWPRFAVLGMMVGIVGAIIVLVMQQQRARFKLTKVTVKVFTQEMEFVINALYRKAAWQLFIETMTRIATQPLETGDGKLREALDSLYSLFETTRRLLKEIDPTPTTEGRTVEALALEMLNRHIRPFLAHWHPLVPERNGLPADPPFDEAPCREDLEDLRKRLLEFARTFGELAGVQQLDEFFDS